MATVSALTVSAATSGLSLRRNSLVSMSDPAPEEIERWLDNLDPDDPTVRVYNVEALGAAINQLHDAVADARERDVPIRVISMLLQDLEDRLSVLLRTGETIPASQLWCDLGISDELSSE